MSQAPLVLPSRPLGVRPPGMSATGDVFRVLGALLVTAGCAFLVGYPIPALIDDFGIRDTARPVPDGHIENGHCSSRMGLVDCSATLRVGSVTRTEHYFFADIHFGDYTAVVVADPAKPEILSTDIALAKMTNRIITLAVAGPLFIFGACAMIYGTARAVGRHRTVRRALDGKELRPVYFRLDGRGQRGGWLVTYQRPDNAIESQKWAAGKAQPIMVDPDRRAILGVTAGDGRIAMPLDSKLKWVKLTRAERKALLGK